MRVLELWRYPVKSLQGEQLTTADVGELGIAGDRGWALVDVDTGFALTARREPRMLFAAARLRGNGEVEIRLPDGTAPAGDAELSAWLGRPVALRRATAERPTFEGTDDDIDWYPWRGAAGAFHDDPDARVSLLSTGTVGAWDRRRFRPNVLLEGSGEEALAGGRVRLGGAVLAVGGGIARCVMVTRPQPGGVEKDPAVLRTLHRERGGRLAVAAQVVQGGTVAVGDPLDRAAW